MLPRPSHDCLQALCMSIKSLEAVGYHNAVSTDTGDRRQEAKKPTGMARLAPTPYALA